MDKKNKKYKDDYSLRTLAYYQREGGIYNELITILQRIRAEKGNSRIRAPHVILNLASEALDDCMWLVDEKGLLFDDLGENFYQLRRTLFDEAGFLWMHVNDNLEDKDIECVLCALCVLMCQIKGLDELVSLLSEHINSGLYHHFAPLIDKNNVRDQSFQLNFLEKQLSIKDSLIREKDSQIADLSNHNSELEKKVAIIEPVYDAYVENIIDGSNFNQHLTLDSILAWIGKRKYYKLADQVIAMLKDLGRKTATDEELEKIESVESELLSKYSELSIVNNNMGIGSNILTGLTQNPMMPMGITPDQLVQKFLEFINNGARRENKD